MQIQRLVGAALLLWCMSACGDDDGSVPAEDSGLPDTSATALIGPSGGTVELSDGSKVRIPPGALTETTSIKVTKLELDDVAPLPANLEPAGKPYAFEPHGKMFLESVAIELPFEGDATEVRPLKLDDQDDTSWQTIVGNTKDAANRKLSLNTTSFSVYLAARPRRNSGVITLSDGAVLDGAQLDGSEPIPDAATDAMAGFDSSVDASSDASSPIGPDNYLKASNSAANDYFGAAIAIDGDTLVVGAFNEDSSAVGVNGNQADNGLLNSGAVYVFVRTGGVWTQQAYLKASNPDAQDLFGGSVAVSGDTIVVGATSESSNATGIDGNQTDDSALRSGAVYVFTRSGSTWTQQAYLKPSNTDAGDSFGYSVAIDGDMIVVGSLGESSNATTPSGDPNNNTASQAGAAYVFQRTGVTWTQDAYLKASNSQAGDHFGQSVGISTTTVVVGADGEDSDATGVNGTGTESANGAGAAYVFTRAGAVWSQQAYLKASNTGMQNAFGYSVAIDGDSIVVSAAAEDSDSIGVNGDQTNSGADGSGAAYVFTRAGTVWTQQAYLKAENTQVSDQFGAEVSISGDRIVCSAWGEDSNATSINGDQADNSENDNGAAYVFVRSGINWSQVAYLKSPNGEQGDLFGDTAAVSGDTVAIGAISEASSATGVGGDPADNGATNSGAAYVFVIP